MLFSKILDFEIQFVIHVDVQNSSNRCAGERRASIPIRNQLTLFHFMGTSNDIPRNMNMHEG